MKRKICSMAIVVVMVALLAPRCAADDPAATIIKRNGYTVSLVLTFTKKKQNTMERIMSVLDYGPNGYATGFVVGDGLVMTAYHVVSGKLSASKKATLGFAPKDELDVKVEVNGCQAKVIREDEAGDIALLRLCQSGKASIKETKETSAVSFQTSIDKDEKLLLIARPHGNSTVRRGVFYGPYMSSGLQFWCAKIDTRDGYSGSPVYNYKAELIGVFTGYDGSKKLAVISPGARAQKLLEDYIATPRP
jgi:S1-C subfamily serine protease